MAQIKIRRGSSASLMSVTLGQGEPAYATDTQKLYIGNADGTKTLINPDGGSGSSPLFRLEITFASGYAGKSFTVTGGGETRTGVVPGNLVAMTDVSHPNTRYTITCNAVTGTVITSSYFGIYSTFFPNELQYYSWAQISSMVESGYASDYFAIGDTKDIKLSTGETLTTQIYNFNHDDLSSGGKAGITFGLKNLMAETRQVNPTGTNSGGFTGSAIYSWLQTTLLTSLPSDLQAVLKTVNKKTSAGSASATINTNAMKVFLFSGIECSGTTTDTYAGEGTKYPIFTDNASRVKRLSNGTGNASIWVSRSPTSGNSGRFFAVNTDGTYTGVHNANNYDGVNFGFCI